MPDNTQLNPGAGGDVVASDDVGGVKFQRVKLALGADGVNDGDLCAANPMPIVAEALPLPVGAATESTVAALQALLSTIAGSIALHNAPFVDGSPGQIMLGKRRDADTTSVADGDLNTLNLDEEGRLKVASKPASYAPTVGNVTSATSTVFVNTERFSNLMIHCTGTFAGVNCTFEGSLNSTNGTDGAWFGVQAIRSNANTVETTTGVLGAAPAYAWELSVNAMKWFRVRATAWTSGTQVWTMIPGTYATEPIPAAQVTATQNVALTAATVRAGFVAGAAIWYDDSATALAANASFTGTSRDLTATATATAMANAATYVKEVRVSAESDQSGTLWVEFSRDNTNWRRAKSAATAAVAGGGQFAEIVFRPSWRYMRVGFTNGATLQGRFAINSMLIAA